MEWMLLPYYRYADFNGRSRRKEYWMFTLFTTLVIAFLALLIGIGGMDSTGEDLNPFGYLVLIAGVIFLLGSFIPGIAVCVRRFHDQDKSGWFYLLNFIPYIGGFVVFVFMLLDGTRGANHYGPDTK
jgi:uncharacterized membrane protein YhaH (DUF805 family)